MTNIPIIYSTDNNYVPYVYCSIKSLSDHVAGSNRYCVYILHTNISAQNRHHLLSLQNDKLRVKLVNVSEMLSKYDTGIFVLSCHFTIETYYRFFLPELFPERNKVLYIDGDTLVQKDVSALYNTDLGDCLLGVTRDCEILRVYHTEGPQSCTYFTQTLGLKNINNYFQAGVMVINLAQMRKEQTTQKLLDCLARIKTPLYVDQDILNVVCQGRVHFISQNWDFTWHLGFVDPQYKQHLPKPYITKYEQAKQDPYIIHFTGEAMKPLDKIHDPLAQRFWRVAAQSPYFSFFLDSALAKRQKHAIFARRNRWKLWRYWILKNWAPGALQHKYAQKYEVLYQKISDYLS